MGQKAEIAKWTSVVITLAAGTAIGSAAMLKSMKPMELDQPRVQVPGIYVNRKTHEEHRGSAYIALRRNLGVQSGTIVLTSDPGT